LGNTFTITETANYDVDNLKPTQDEIYPANTFPKLCKDPAAPALDPNMKPFISSDDYIIDGHHRWSCWMYCGGLKGNAGAACSDTTGGKCTVKKATATMVAIMTEVIKVAKNAWGAGVVPAPGNKVPNPTVAPQYFASFVEIDERFGSHMFATEAEAAAAYVKGTREIMASYGFALKGGDEALHTLWKAHHAPRLWN